MTTINNRLRNILILAILFLTIQYGKGQAVGTPYIIPTQDIPFSFLTGGTQTESPGAVEQTNDGGYITIGTSISSATGDLGTNHGQSDIMIVKYDQYGKRQWQRLYGGDQYEYGYSIKQTTDGGYIFVGMTSSSGTGNVMTVPINHGDSDIWVVKLTATGAISWQKVYGGNRYTATQPNRAEEYGKIIHQTADGGYIVGGYTFSSASGDVSSTRPANSSDFWVLKITSTGVLSWQQAYGNPTGGNGADFLYGLDPTSDGTGYILGGYDDVANGNFFAVKINLTGASVWKKSYGGSAVEACYSSFATSDGGVIMAGYSTSSANGDVTPTNHGGEDMWVIKLNSTGNIQWQRLLGGTGNERAHSVIQTADGGYMVAGYSNSSANGDVTASSHGDYDVCVFKLSSTGVTQWHRLYGGVLLDGYALSGSSGTLVNLNPVRIRQVVDGNYIITSTSGSSDNGTVTDTNNGTGGNSNADQWLFKFDQSGNIVWVPDVGQKN